MKLSIVAGVVLVLALAGVAQATPLYYTFEGPVVSIHDFTSGRDVDSMGGISIDDILVYTFLVDFDAPGFSEHLGVITPTGGFFVDFLGGGPTLPLTGSESFEYHTNETDDAGGVGLPCDPTCRFVGSSPSVFLNWVVVGSSSVFSDWAVGEHFGGDNYADDTYGPGASGLNAQVFSDLTLIRIDPEASVPEPGSCGLVAVALVILGLRRRPAE